MKLRLSTEQMALLNQSKRAATFMSELGLSHLDQFCQRHSVAWQFCFLFIIPGNLHLEASLSVCVSWQKCESMVMVVGCDHLDVFLKARMCPLMLSFLYLLFIVTDIHQCWCDFMCYDLYWKTTEAAECILLGFREAKQNVVWGECIY